MATDEIKSGTNTDVDESPEKSNVKRKRIVTVIIIAALLVGIYGFRSIRFSMTHERTDNAQIDGNLLPLRTNVSGFIKEIRFRDNQQVIKGDTLIIFDTEELVANLTRAKSQLLNAQLNYQSATKGIKTASLGTATAKYNSASAEENINSAKTRQWQAQADYERMQKLFRDSAATQQALDNAKAQLDLANSQVTLFQKQFEASQSQFATSNNQADIQSLQVQVADANIKQAEAALVLAESQYEKAFVIAPCSGIISKKAVEVGQFVPAGVALASIVDTGDLWVTANFKETQMENIRAGDEAKIDVDAFPDLDIDGKVQSISGATGAKFSLLPADNATGNFIKITQRVPVKITMILPKENQLRPGLSVLVTVTTK